MTDVMKKLLLLFVLMAGFVGGSAAPILSHVFGFTPAVAHAQEDPGQQGDDDSDGDNDNQ